MIEARITGVRGNHRLDLQLHMAMPWTVLFGASGAGKSSVLRAIAGLWRPESAAVKVDGKDISDLPTHLRRVALVGQSPALFPHKTARENILFGSRDGKVDEALLSEFGLRQLSERKPHDLSGGEQQRVAIIRAIASRPRVLLLDEVFSGTEVALRSEMIAALRHWQQRASSMIVSVTHDVADALTCADEVVMLRDGKIQAQGPPRDVLSAERAALRQTLTD